ncbi:MAG: glycosyltransferase family 4 protein, partial [Nanoarchaeota archaeon]|nr:glycosyltransferase family 4 protein [Nanoarchaeota archaeon]
MKILFVCENYLPHIGGVEIVFKTLAEGLIKKGHQVNLVTHQLKNTKKFEIINGVKVHRIPCFDSRYLFTFLSIPKIIKLAQKADLIHTTTFNGAPPAWLVSKIKNKPCLLTVHEVWVNQWQQITEMSKTKATFHNFLEKLIYKLKFTKYIAVSNSTKNQLVNLRIPETKITVIHNGIDYNHWNPSKYDRNKIRNQLNLQHNFVYLFHGRPGTSKGLIYLIKAVPLISKLIPNSKLLAIVSKDPAYKKNYQKIIKLIKKLKIENQIILHNPVNYQELPRYIKAADCVIVPSLAEGFGFSAAEACAMNVPIIASNTTSLPEVVSGKYILVPSKNSKAIAQAVHSVSKEEYN